MNKIIHEITEKFITNILEVIAVGGSFGEVEVKLLKETKEAAAKLLSTYVESIDDNILKDKAGRKAAGYVVERRGDIRCQQSLIGDVRYERTYYAKASGGYEYLADMALGVERYSRISDNLGQSLVNAAKDMSYGRASNHITNGEISRQTVMNTVRQMEVKLKESEKTRKVPELHIDADEAHITLKGGGKSQVPLISVYEGIEAHGKRKKCKNIFHISEYGMKTDDLWEKVLSEIEMRYELDETKIYLHGDGANWIAQGLEWIPKSVFVLDKYHKNKAIKQITAGLESKYRKEYEKEIRKALSQEDMDLFNENVLDIYSQFPERKDKIVGAAKYLQNFVHGISICERDPQANNGGCTEPHVSHILSSRLSSRPMAWSEKTLKNLAPMLAGYEIKGKSKEEIVPNVVEKAVKCVKKTLSKGSTLGLPSPSAIGALEPLKLGKVTTLYQMMKKI